MQGAEHSALVEIVAQQKGCMLCDLAVGILEEIQPDFESGALRWQAVDVEALTAAVRGAIAGFPTV